MLVLSRKEGESVWIGPSIRITVMKSTGTTVRLGIEAPPDFKVLRDELVPVDWTSTELGPLILGQSSRKSPSRKSPSRKSSSRKSPACRPSGPGIPAAPPLVAPPGVTPSELTSTGLAAAGVASSGDVTTGEPTACRGSW
jgi:carbon storage regulator CsrA